MDRWTDLHVDAPSGATLSFRCVRAPARTRGARCARRPSRPRAWHLAAAAAALVLPWGTAEAVSVQIQIAPVADATVQKGQPDSNFGSLPDIFLKNDGAGGLTRHGYFRFDLSGLTDDEVLSASFSLAPYFSFFDQPFRVYGLNDGTAPAGGKLGEGWAEAAITWNNAPGNDTADNALIQGSGPGSVTFLDQSDSFSGGNILFDGSALVSFLNADSDGDVTLIVQRVVLNQGSSGNAAFKSRDNTGGLPLLTLTQEVPEPGASLLLLAGVAGLAFAGRRRAPRLSAGCPRAPADAIRT